MPDAESTPYAALTPDVILDALDGVGIRGDGRLLALPSYENRVWQVWCEDAAPVVVKFYRPDRWTGAQILEEHAFVAELAAEEVPAVAPLAFGDRTLCEHAGFRFAVYPRAGGRAPELDDDDTLEWIGRYVGRIHSVGARARFAHRPALDANAFGAVPRAWLLEHDCLPADLRTTWEGVSAQALDGVLRVYARVGPVAGLRLHGDVHGGNVLWVPDGAGAGPHFVDFDDARTGPAVQDLWMLLSGSRADQERQVAIVLRGYRRFHDFDARELALVEALRTLRLLNYSAWIAQRWHDPAFPAAFPWFGTQRYWQDRVLELREQIAALDEPPLAELR